MSRKYQNETNNARSSTLTETKAAKVEEKTTKNTDEISKKAFKSATISTVQAVEEGESNSQWSISFEQLLASLLTDNMLVEYFDIKYDLNKKLAEYKSQHA